MRARAVSRKLKAKTSTIGSADFGAEVVWFCVPDSMIARVASDVAKSKRFMAQRRCKFAFHSSGVLSSDSLDVLRQRGIAVASVHPLMTFVEGSAPALDGVTFAVEGDPSAADVARGIVRDLGGDFLLLTKKEKAAYHAFATMICPLLVSLFASAEKIAEKAGITAADARRRMTPIVLQTIKNYAKLGPAKAFTGPIVRGDIGTIQLHLEALKKEPAAKRAYVALAGAALERLPNRNKKKLIKLLKNA